MVLRGVAAGWGEEGEEVVGVWWVEEPEGEVLAWLVNGIDFDGVEEAVNKSVVGRRVLESMVGWTDEGRGDTSTT